MEELPGEPRGLFFQRDFVSPSHEASLIALFRTELLWPVRSADGSIVHRRLVDLVSDTPSTRNAGNACPADRRTDADAKAAAAEVIKLGTTRLSLHYGLHFEYRTMGVSDTAPVPFPEWLLPLLPSRSALALEHGYEHDREHEDRDPDQVCLQYYPPGSGIPPHADTHSVFDRLYALSLGAPVEMEFRRPRPRPMPESVSASTYTSAQAQRSAADDVASGLRAASASSGQQSDGSTTPADDREGPGRAPGIVSSCGGAASAEGGDGIGDRGGGPIAAHGDGDGSDKWQRRLVDLQPRSLLRMEGEARYHWQHGIKKRRTDVVAADRDSSTADALSGRTSDTTSGVIAESSNASTDSAARANRWENTPAGETSETRRPRGDRWSITYRWLRRPMPGVCECGDVWLCDTAQARAGVERVFRWKT